MTNEIETGYFYTIEDNEFECINCYHENPFITRSTFIPKVFNLSRYTSRKNPLVLCLDANYDMFMFFNRVEYILDEESKAVCSATFSESTVFLTREYYPPKMTRKYPNQIKLDTSVIISECLYRLMSSGNFYKDSLTYHITELMSEEEAKKLDEFFLEREQINAELASISEMLYTNPIKV